MKLRQNRVNSCCCWDLISRWRVIVIFVILILKFNYALSNQETGDNSDAISTADSIPNDIMLNDETFKFYDNVDELAANLFNDTVTEYPNDEEDIDEDNLKKLMENYDKTYTNETWIVVGKDNDIIDTIHDIVEGFETGPSEEIIIVTHGEDNVRVSQRQHNDLQFGLEIVTGSSGASSIDTVTEDSQTDIFARDEIEETPSAEAVLETGFDVRADDVELQTTTEFFTDECETNDDFRSDDFEPQTTEIDERLQYITTEISDFGRIGTKLDDSETEDLLIEELNPIIVERPEPELAYEDYTTEEETTSEIPDIEELIGHKMYLHEPEINFDYKLMTPPESTTSKPILIPDVLPTTAVIELAETTPKPSILQKISTYMSGIFNYRYGLGEGRNFDDDPYDFSTEIFDDFVTTGYDTNRKRVEEQSIIEIEKILDPEVQNEFIRDIVIDKSPELQAVFQKPDDSNIINRGLHVNSSTDTIDVEKFLFDKINRDAKSSIAEYDEEIIDNNLYANPLQNLRVHHEPVIDSKTEDKTIIELVKINDPDVQNEFIMDIRTMPAIEMVKVLDNTEGDTEAHVTERNFEENGRHIHDENKVVSIENADVHRVTHENVHIEQSNDTFTADQTKVEIETDNKQRVEVQHVTHKEDEKDVHTEKKSEHVTIDEPGLHLENHETIETTKTIHGDVTNAEDVITKDLDNVHVVEKVRVHEDNGKVYERLMEKEEEIKKNKNKIDELKKEIDILKEDIHRPNELIAYEAEVLKTKGFLPDKLELIADYLNLREHQLHGDTDKYGLKRYLQRLTKERELDILKHKKDKLKKQLANDFKEFISAEQKFGIQLDGEIEKLDGDSKSSSSISSKSKSDSSDEHDSHESSEEQMWSNFVQQARLAAEERVHRRDEEVKLLQHVLNDDSAPEIRLDHILLPSFVLTTPIPVLFPDVDQESQIILLETLVRLPTIEKENDLRNFPLTTDLPFTTDESITEDISIEIDEIEKIVDEPSHTVKIVDKRILLHNGDENLEIDETITTQNGDTQTEVHNKRSEKIDEKTRSRIIEVLLPKLRAKSIEQQNATRQNLGRALSADEPVVEQTNDNQEPDDEPSIAFDDDSDSVITNVALRTVIEGVELTSEIARSVDTFRSPIEKITEILNASNHTIKTKTHDELADQLGRAEEILGIEENKIVAEIAELELVDVNLALILFCILCTFLILIITIIFFLRKSKRFGGLNFIPV